MRARWPPSARSRREAPPPPAERARAGSGRGRSFRATARIRGGFRARAAPSSLRLRDRDLVEDCAVGEMRLLRLVPPAEHLVDGEQLETGELARVAGGGPRGPRPVVGGARGLL